MSNVELLARLGNWAMIQPLPYIVEGVLRTLNGMKGDNGTVPSISFLKEYLPFYTIKRLLLSAADSSDETLYEDIKSEFDIIEKLASACKPPEEWTNYRLTLTDSSKLKRVYNFIKDIERIFFYNRIPHITICSDEGGPRRKLIEDGDDNDDNSKCHNNNNNNSSASTYRSKRIITSPSPCTPKKSRPPPPPPPTAAAVPPVSNSSVRVKWTAEEEAALRNGLAKHGKGSWTDILKDPEFNALLNRSGKQLKDKARYLNKK